jgi:acetyl-CoA/propionyl-CoA carboxylase, biotin carboxylase, biotin carboxyl carrier protein
MSHQRRDASMNFAPAPGKIGRYREPSGPGVRVDSGVGPGSEISPMYEPMVPKLIVWDADRAEATKRVLRALHEYEIEGLKTLIPFHKALLATEEWAQGSTCRELLEDKEWLKTLAFEPIAGAADEAVEQAYTVEHGQLLCVIEAMKMENEITAHKAGVIADLPISEGAPIRAGDPIP